MKFTMNCHSVCFTGYVKVDEMSADMSNYRSMSVNYGDIYNGHTWSRNQLIIIKILTDMPFSIFPTEILTCLSKLFTTAIIAFLSRCKYSTCMHLGSPQAQSLVVRHSEGSTDKINSSKYQASEPPPQAS